MKASILIVDDEQGMRALLRAALSRNGYEPVVAKDGNEALEVLGRQKIDLILSDVAMPAMTGYEFFQRVRDRAQADSYFAFIPFIFITSRSLPGDVRFGKSLGVDDYLIKPVDEEDLLAVIQGKLRAKQLALQAIGQGKGDEIGLRIKNHQLLIHCAQHRAWVDEREIVVSARAMFLLECLARNPNRVVSLSDLIEETHGFETDPIEAGNLIRPLVRRLRSRFKEHGLDAAVQNIRGRGYMLVTGNSADI